MERKGRTGKEPEKMKEKKKEKMKKRELEVALREGELTGRGNKGKGI